MDNGPHTTSRQSEYSSNDGCNGSGAKPSDALKSAMAHLAEMKEFAANYFAAKADSAKLSFRRVVLMAVMGIVAGIAGATMLITAVVLLLIGIANAIGAIFSPPKPWVGQLVVGALVVAATFITLILIVRKITGASRAKTMAKYESRHAKQRERFGHDINEAAPATSSGTSSGR